MHTVMLERFKFETVEFDDYIDIIMSINLRKQHTTITLVVVLGLLVQISFSQSKLKDLLPEIEKVIEKGKQNIWDEIEPN